MKLIRLLIATFALALAAHAQLIQSFTGGDNLNVGPGTAGYEFTVGNAPLTIAALGVWSENESLFQPHKVGIWDLAQNLIAQATVTPGTAAPLNGFWYANITPLTLNANTHYVIAAQYADVDFDQARGNVPSVTTDSRITLGDAFLSSGIGFSYPDINVSGADLGFFGPNAAFSAVPEVGSSIATALLLAAFALHRRCRTYAPRT